MMDGTKEKEDNNRLRDQRRKNIEETRKPIIATHQKISPSKTWRGLNFLFNLTTSCQVFEFVEERMEVIVS